MLNPDPTMSEHRLPVVDFHGFLYGDRTQRQRVAEEISAACSAFGFFYLVNHGVSAHAVAAGFAAAEEFFGQPIAQRMACKSKLSNQNRGYQPMFDTARHGGKPDLKESFDMGFPLPADDADLRAGVPFHSTNNWPQPGVLPGFQDRIENLYDGLLACGHQVMRAMALALRADENFFVGRCAKPTTNMRLVHYPPQGASTEEGIGASAHADRGLITLLLNDSNGGLHVEFEDGRWIDAPPLEGGLIVNVGDLMTRWTNGRFRSAIHRVVNTTGRERYSIPQFHHPGYYTVVDPVELGVKGAVKFDAVTAGEFVATGFKRDRKSWQVGEAAASAA